MLRLAALLPALTFSAEPSTAGSIGPTATDLTVADLPPTTIAASDLDPESQCWLPWDNTNWTQDLGDGWFLVEQD